ncbi:MAG: uroporphyrinogen-III synthase [Epsilonproteobacteria bacterium]|nr:uroporphyrinogen-III synthase [Campylobacterota bacterium]
MEEIVIVSNSTAKGAKTLGVITQNFLSPEIELKKYNYLIFTSKNGVKAIDRLDPYWKKIPSLVIGKATAKEVEKLGGRVEYVASKFYGDSLAKELKKQFSPQKNYLYLRPKKVSSNLTQILKESGFKIEEKVVYETRCQECNKLPSLPKKAYLIFSSPSSVECFFNCFNWKEGFKAVAIGAKTAKILADNVEDILVFEGSTLQEIVESLS